MLKTHKQIISFSALAMLFFSSLPAYGYIDPGTGSLLIQGIIGAIAAAGVTLKIYWHKLKILFMGKKVESNDDTPEE